MIAFVSESTRLVVFMFVVLLCVIILFPSAHILILMCDIFTMCMLSLIRYTVITCVL